MAAEAGRKAAEKEKKPRVAKSGSLSHPTYFLMIKEAILVLREESGSSPYAIAKQGLSVSELPEDVDGGKWEIV